MTDEQQPAAYPAARVHIASSDIPLGAPARPARKIRAIPNTIVLTAASPVRLLIPQSASREYAIVQALDTEIIVCDSQGRAQSPANEYTAQAAEVTPANPAAASDYSYVMTGPATLGSVAATLVNSAVAGNRVLHLQILDAAGNLVTDVPGCSGVAASTTISASWVGGVGNTSSSSSVTAVSALPQVQLQAGWTVKIHVAGMQAGDQLSAITLTFNVAAADVPGPEGAVITPGIAWPPIRCENALWVTAATFPARVSVIDAIAE